MNYPFYELNTNPTLSLDLTGNTLSVCDDEIGDEIVICDNVYDNSLFCMENNVPELLCNSISGNTFCGGFYQGYYRLHEYEFNRLPNIEKGWSIEFVINTDTSDCNCEGNSLNDLYPENKGIFFYWGLKSLPYFGYDLSGETSCEGYAYNMDFDIILDNGYDNDFLYYTEQNIVCDPKLPTKTIKFKDYCLEAAYNAIAFKVSGSTISTILLEQSGECISGTTNHTIITKIYNSGNILNEGWNHLIIKWEPNDNECNDDKLGRLSFYINGKRKYFIDGFKQFNPQPLPIHKSLQLGIPYNMSIGGGTMGNLLDPHQPLEDGQVCVYDLCLTCETFISGITIDGVLIDFNQKLYINDVEKVKAELIKLFGDKIDVRNTGKKHEYLNITITTYKTINGANTNFGLIPFHISDCIDFIAPTSCSVLEDNFAGTFEGKLDCFRFYEFSLTIQDIYDLFSNKKDKFDINVEKICC